MSKLISVIICTHNPRHDFFVRVLEALKKQTLAHDKWELLVVDNASSVSVELNYKLTWHPNSRFIQESSLGQIHARLRGIKESEASLIVFVDDDNLLDPDYLDEALRIFNNYPLLGAWGGQCFAEYEVDPPDHLKHLVSGLAIRSVNRDYWTNVPGPFNLAYPYGAGLCVRRKIAIDYASLISSDPVRQQIGRKGEQLTSGDDYELLLTCCEAGLGCGVFRALKLTHLIPKRRLTEQYILDLYRGHAYSNYLINMIHGVQQSDPLKSILSRLMWVIRLARKPSFERKYFWATLQGTHAAAEFFRKQIVRSRSEFASNE